MKARLRTTAHGVVHEFELVGPLPTVIVHHDTRAHPPFVVFVLSSIEGTFSPVPVGAVNYVEAAHQLVEVPLFQHARPVCSDCRGTGCVADTSPGAANLCPSCAGIGVIRERAP